MLKKVKLSESKSKRFKNAFTEVARSQNLSLHFLNNLVNKYKKYGRAYLLISEDQLPGKIQTYIKQNPYFILSWSSIANLPTIGTSKRFDVFLFSPHKMFPTPDTVFKEFQKIDKSIKTHPLKIYSLDPLESFSNKIKSSIDFAEAISFFEFGSYDFSHYDKLSRQQVISILEHNSLSLGQIIKELPISVFSEIISDDERKTIDEIARKYLIDNESPYNVFKIIGNQSFKEKFLSIDTNSIKYSKKEIKRLYITKITKPKHKARLEKIYRQLSMNIKMIHSMISEESK